MHGQLSLLHWKQLAEQWQCPCWTACLLEVSVEGAGIKPPAHARHLASLKRW